MAAMPCNGPLSKFGAAVLLGLIAACSGKPAVAPPSGVSSLQSTEIKAGTGEPVTAGKVAVVQYTGWLYEAAAKDSKGKQFDSSRSSGQPFRFPVGTGQVIKGWDQGVLGMKVGESRRLVIPPHLASGDSGAVHLFPPGPTLLAYINL